MKNDFLDKRNIEINYKEISIYYFAGTLFNKGISFLALPIFTRLLSTYDYGVVTTFNSWVLILKMILGLALHSAIQVAYVDHKTKYAEFTSSIIWFSILNSMIDGCILCLLFKITDKNMLYLVLCVLNAFSLSVIDDFCVYLMMQYRYKLRTCMLILPNFIAVILSVVMISNMSNTEKYWGRIFPCTLVQLMFALLAILLMCKECKPILHKEYIIYGLKVSIPLIAHGIALTVLAQSDRIMLTSISGAEQTGIYSLIFNFAALSTVVTTSVDGIWVPWFYKKISAREIKDINSASKVYLDSIALIMDLVILVSPEIIKLMADAGYWEGISIIPPIILSNYVVFMYSLYVNIEHYHKKTIFIMINTIIAATLNISLNFLFIPRYGYVAASFTTIASYFISFILHSHYANKLEPDLFEIKLFVGAIISIFITTIVFYIFQNIPMIRWFIAIYLGTYTLLKNKDAIKNFLRSRIDN